MDEFLTLDEAIVMTMAVLDLPQEEAEQRILDAIRSGELTLLEGSNAFS